ncbi:MAG: helix-turn-helix domain-containing protein [Streptosporangiales bacterium]|nr:helix-turn-helix domain-containing protein [Streptosporangiales bacterium]
MEDAATRGQRIARARRRRGLSQSALAGLVGRSESWLSQVERGVKALDSHSVLGNLARVLGVDVEELTGGEPEIHRATRYSAAREIERAMMRYEALDAAIDGREGRPSDLENLRRGIRRANALYQATRYDEVGGLLPRLIRSAEAAARMCLPRDRPAVHAVRAEVYQATTALLSRVGEPQLAWTAGDRSVTAAEHAEAEILMAVGAYRLGHAFIRRRRTAEAKDLVMVAAHALERTMKRRAQPEQLSMWGSLHLVAATAAAVDFDRAEVDRFLGEARVAAERLNGDRNDHWTAFGPTNVRIHEVSTAVAVGDAGLAVEAGEALDVSELSGGLIGRRCQIYLDLAWAYAQQRHDAAAVNQLLGAERLAPELVRYDDRTHELLATLLRREHRPSTPELRPLARRAGAI